MSTISNWSAKVSDSEAARRAGGRLRYNTLRQDKAWARRGEIIKEWSEGELWGWNKLYEPGGRARLAERLGVSRSTLTRDLAAVKKELGC